MDCETNIDPIRALERQIGEYERIVINLKRTRNSLLNVSKLPPEILGNIFRWNVTLQGDFGGLDKITQLPRRLSPLVRGGFADSGALEFLGQYPKGLGLVVLSFRNRSTRPGVERELLWRPRRSRQ